MLLDRVQRKQRIGRDEHARLKASGLVEGRYPSLMVAAAVAKATGDAGRHIRERGFERQYYRDLTLALLRTHGPVGRKEIDDAVLAKLPDRLTSDQKQTRVRNLIQGLVRQGSIRNDGPRTRPRWVLLEKQVKKPGAE